MYITVVWFSEFFIFLFDVGAGSKIDTFDTHSVTFVSLAPGRKLARRTLPRAICTSSSSLCTHGLLCLVSLWLLCYFKDPWTAAPRRPTVS